MSFTGPMDPLLERIIKEAADKGVIFIAAAGNNGPKGAPVYPAAYPEVIAVTATDEKDKLYGKANRGDYICIAAPGVDIIAPALKGSYDAVVRHVDGRGPCLGRGGAAARARRKTGLERTSARDLVVERAEARWIDRRQGVRRRYRRCGRRARASRPPRQTEKISAGR